jgi:hypothetical protein
MKAIVFIFSIILLGLTTETKAQALYPFGDATALTIATSGTTAITVTNRSNYVASVPTLTANITVSVTAGSRLKPGAEMLLTVKTTSTETTTFVGAIVAPVVTGVAGKTWSQAFIYNGTNFYPCGAKIQVD